ncbi:MAG: glycosyltransferase [Lachnospiraceae bacterium]|nr:glycosyltransferase [Lachnospiraceae bacterium]
MIESGVKLSIVITSYNASEYLPEAIESCLNKDFNFKYEIIIVDDGSSDGSIAIIKKYYDEYKGIIRYHIVERNGVDIKTVIPSIRVSNNMKYAFGIANGEYIICLSGDDVFSDNDAISRFVEYLDNNQDKVACYGDFTLFWNDGKEKKIVNNFTPGRLLFWASEYVHISSFLFRKICTKYLLDRFCDDTGMTYSIIYAGRIGYIKQEVFKYRQRDGSIVHNSDKVELNITELMLFQDILNFKKYYWSSLCRMHHPIAILFKKKDELDKKRYSKYLLNCENYANNILCNFFEYNRLSIGQRVKLRGLVLAAYASCYYHFVFRKARNLVYKIFGR